MNKSDITPRDADIFTIAAEPEVLHEEDVYESSDGLGAKVARLLVACWVRRWMMIAIITVGILLALAKAFVEPAYYSATTTLMPPGNESAYTGLMAMFAGESGAGIENEVLGMGTPSELFIGILQSRTVQDAMVKRFDLAKQLNAGSNEDARIALAGSTVIDEDRKSGIISISVTAGGAQMAANLANGYVEELNKVVLTDSTSSARRERIFLEERLADVKQDLDTSASAISQFSVKNKTADLSTQSKSMVDEGLRMQAELIEGKSQLAGLRQIYSEDNFRVKELEAHNAELQREMDAMGGTAKGSGASNSAQASGYPTVGQLAALGPTYANLERRERVDEALWETLTKNYEAAKVEEARQIPTVRVLDAAEVPSRKAGPIRRRIVEIGALLSMLLACLIVFVLTWWEQLDPASELKRIASTLFSSTAKRRELDT